jgi:hypothetical protein
MREYVYVVTSVEMGWDCVCGVYKTPESAYRSCFHDNEEGLTLEEMEARVEDGDTSYVVHAKRLQV